MASFEKIVGDIYVLKAPFGGLWTGVTLIRGEKNYLIDSGADAPEVYLIPALRELGLELSDISYLLNTHCHGDHISGHYDLVSKYGLRVATARVGAKTLSDPASNAVRIRTRFPEFSPAPQSWLKGVEADVVLEDGEVLDGRLRLILTPGHDHDCVAWYDIPSKTIICGDSLQANGTPSQGVGFYSDLSAYLSALDRLLSEDIENIICGHEYDGMGDFILGCENVKQALTYCKELPEAYEKKIAQYLKDGMTEPSEIAVRLINEVGCGMPEKLFLALYTVTQHLARLNP